MAAVQGHWATSGDLADALEQLAIEAMVLAADADDALDDLEDGLFRFGRVVASTPDLRAALADPALPGAGKHELLGTLLNGKVTPVTLSLIAQMVEHPRGRALHDGPGHVRRLRGAAQAAADRGGALGGGAVRRASVAAGRGAGPGLRTQIHLNVVIDPAVLGGISIQIGDELIDGTAVSRLAAVRRELAG